MKIFFRAVIFTIALCGSNMIHASMIGDQLLIERLYPDLGTTYRPPVSTTVEIGIGDIVTSHGHVQFNPEAFTISMDYQNTSAYGGGVDFNGFMFTGFSDAIQNVTIDSVNNISITGLNFGNNFITLDLAGNSFDSSSFIELGVDFENVSSVPTPAAVWLMGSGLIGLVGRRKKLAKLSEKHA